MKTELANSVKTLNNNQVILCPTDTIWGIGCDATNENAVKRIFSIKKRNESKSLIILVNSFSMLEKYVSKIPTAIIECLELTNKPTTVVYKNPKNIANNAVALDNTIAIRIVNTGFIYKLISKFNKPIVSTSANISGKITAIHFSEISKEIKEKVDYIVDLPKENMTLKASTLITLNDQNKIVILRK